MNKTNNKVIKLCFWIILIDLILIMLGALGALSWLGDSKVIAYPLGGIIILGFACLFYFWINILILQIRNKQYGWFVLTIAFGIISSILYYLLEQENPELNKIKSTKIYRQKS